MHLWPPGFHRVPDEAWARAPVDGFAKAYDGLKGHSWYANLEPTLRGLRDRWRGRSGVLLDYAGGTGILADQLFAKGGPELAGMGVLNVDASAKFLRLAVDKHGGDPRCAFRLLQPLRAPARLQALQDAVPELAQLPLQEVVCANAVHLFPSLREAIGGWAQAMPAGGHLHVQSGNIGPACEGEWLIDETVLAVEQAARRLVAQEPGLARHRETLADAARMAAYDGLRQRFFPPPRPAQAYVDALSASGFQEVAVTHRRVEVLREDWSRFLTAYAEGILPWAAGSERVGDPAPGPALREARRALLEDALRVALPQRFWARWTYLDATAPGQDPA